MNARDDALHEAVKAGNIDEIKRLVKVEGIGVNALDSNFRLPPVATAAKHGKVEAMKTLIELGANIHFKIPYNGIPLYKKLLRYAIRGGIETFKLLLAQPSFIFNPNEEVGGAPNNTALWCASRWNQWEIVKFMLQNCPNLNLSLAPTRKGTLIIQVTMCEVIRWEILQDIISHPGFKIRDAENFLLRESRPSSLELEPSPLEVIIQDNDHNKKISLYTQLLMRYTLLNDKIYHYTSSIPIWILLLQFATQFVNTLTTYKLTKEDANILQGTINEMQAFYNEITHSMLNESSISSFNKLPAELRQQLALLMFKSHFPLLAGVKDEFIAEFINLFKEIYSAEAQAEMEKKFKLMAATIVGKWQQAHLNFFFERPHPDHNQLLRAMYHNIASLLSETIFQGKVKWLHQYNPKIYHSPSYSSFPQAFIPPQLIAHITAHITKLSPMEVNTETLKNAIDEALKAAMAEVVANRRNLKRARSEEGDPEKKDEVKEQKEEERQTKKPRYRQLTLIGMWATRGREEEDKVSVGETATLTKRNNM